jgi:isopentenyl diphosphate isomerase/L-lactate dehydrogenase-like FMN-dependent dehydrogenase
LLGHVDELGVKAIFVTVDAPVLGKRRKIYHGLTSPGCGNTRSFRLC